ncbi:unnamed protein product [Paramecium sonneborni]|uniref:Uncharacterized protein n=1 Tax=Paramecium sonneborni TaxID=65129 RepID=A0A8S1RH36_9CILI|nr:unnamed protein product [Paramecium sonneborni]
MLKGIMKILIELNCGISNTYFPKFQVSTIQLKESIMQDFRYFIHDQLITKQWNASNIKEFINPQTQQKGKNLLLKVIHFVINSQNKFNCRAFFLKWCQNIKFKIFLKNFKENNQNDTQIQQQQILWFSKSIQKVQINKEMKKIIFEKIIKNIKDFLELMKD